MCFLENNVMLFIFMSIKYIKNNVKYIENILKSI